MSKDKFLIKRLVMVDSAGLCYVELPVDRHAMLLGKGNVGKSSLLNAIRLFLLPENNFKNSKNKFAFKVPNKDDYYSNDDSYNHYFPSSRSFLILEVENHVGTHCQILYRSQNMGFNRIFTPLAYDQIRSLFWQVGPDDDGEEDGIGHAVADLSVSKVSENLKKFAPKTVMASDTGKLKRMLYANNFLDMEEMRYCLFPLTETDDSRIESLRTLILLLFEMNTGADSVAKAVASIIEADKKYATDALEFDIEEFLQKHLELKANQQTLTRIRNFESRFNSLKNDYAEYTRLGEVDSHFCKLTQRLEKQTLDIRSEREILANTYQESNQKYKDSDNKLKQLKQEKYEQDVLIRDCNKTISEEQRHIDVVESLKLQYASHYPVSEILQISQEAFDNISNQREALKDEDKSAQRKIKLLKLIQEGKENETSLEQRLLNEQFRLDAQLPGNVLEPLAAVNKKLVLANPCRSLSELETKIISEFSTLFDCSSEQAKWFDQSFHKQSQPLIDDVEKQLETIRDELHTWNRSLSDLTSTDTSLPRQKKIEDADKEIKSLEKEITALKRYEAAKLNFSEAQAKLMLLERTLNSLNAKFIKLEENNDLLKSKTAQCKTELEVITTKNDTLVDLAKRKQSLCFVYPRLKDALSIWKGDIVLDEETSPVNQENFDQLDSDLRQLDKLKDKIINELRESVHENIIEDDHEIRKQVPSSNSVKYCMQRISDVYSELPQQENVLMLQVHEHNESVASYIKVLTDNNEHVQRFESQLNRDFSQVRINDLEQVAVSISVHPKFRNLITEINKFDLHGDKLPSDEFYERLRVFVGEFFNGSSDTKLTMDKIVTNLSYRTKKVGEERLQTKQQSNSTTALINFEMVQVLLNKVLHSSANVAMPLVLDEAATIDLAQFDWLLPHLSERGFSLFAASTYSASAELIHKIGVYHEIGMMKTSQPYHNSRTIVYWGGGEGFYANNDPSIMDISVVEREQISFLDGDA
jgi:polyhydroxyalkanoate synthesis regulator phasin